MRLRGHLGRAGEDVENSPLRLGIEQRLRFVLAVQIHEVPTDLGEQRRAHRAAVHPCTCPSRGGNLSLQNDQWFVGVDAVFVEQRCDLLALGDVEHTFDRRALGAGANEVRARTLAEEQARAHRR